MHSLKKRSITLFFFQKIILTPFLLMAEEDFSVLTIQISELQQEIQQLNGKIEEFAHELEKLNKKVDVSIADTEIRIQDQNPLVSSALNLEKKLSTGDVQEQYENAIQLLRAGEYEAAREAFLNFINNYPQEELMVQAHYWYGMTFFLEKDYKKAAKIFAENYQKYPKSPKMFDSLLRLAQSLGALGKTKDACTTLEELLSSIPGKQKNPLQEEAQKEKITLKCPA